MERRDYLGSALFKENSSRKTGSIQANKGHMFSEVVDGVYITENQLLTYQDDRNWLLIDGYIHLYNNLPFQKKRLAKLAAGLSEDLENTLMQLDGEYTIIIVNKIRNTLVSICSETGSSAFFYQFLDQEIVFGNSFSSMRKLLEGRNALNFQRVYQVAAGIELGSEETFLTGIKKVLPGYYLIFSAEGHKVVKYSSLLEIHIRKEPADMDYYESFRSIFTSSLLRRSNYKTIGIALSGGRDSSAIASMMARLQPQEQKIYTFTFKPQYVTKTIRSVTKWDESPMVEELIRQYPALTSQYLGDRKTLLLDGLIRSLTTYGEPVYGASNQFWIHELHNRMLSEQIQVLFTGQGGNYTLSWPPPELVNGKRKNPVYLLRRLVRKSVTRTDPLFLADSFLDEVNDTHERDAGLTTDLETLQTRLLRNSIYYVSSLQKQVFIKHGFRVSDPTVDRELVAFCLSLPLNFYHDSHFTRKLVNVGLKGIVPESILSNTVRGIQSSDLPFRLEMERDAIYEKLRFLNTNYLVKFVFDIESLVKEWKYFDFFQFKRRELNSLLRLLLLSIFIEQFEHR